MRSWFPIAPISLIIFSRMALPAGYHYSVGFTIDALLVAVLIAQLLQLYGSRLWRWLELAAVRYLGKISYPIYLYHQWGASFGRRVHVPSLQFAGGVVATVALASGSYYVVERPFLKLKARFSSENPQPVRELLLRPFGYAGREDEPRIHDGTAPRKSAQA